MHKHIMLVVALLIVKLIAWLIMLVALTYQVDCIGHIMLVAYVTSLLI